MKRISLILTLLTTTCLAQPPDDPNDPPTSPPYALTEWGSEQTSYDGYNLSLSVLARSPDEPAILTLWTSHGGQWFNSGTRTVGSTETRFVFQAFGSGDPEEFAWGMKSVATGADLFVSVSEFIPVGW